MFPTLLVAWPPALLADSPLLSLSVTVSAASRERGRHSGSGHRQGERAGKRADGVADEDGAESTQRTESATRTKENGTRSRVHSDSDHCAAAIHLSIEGCWVCALLQCLESSASCPRDAGSAWKGVQGPVAAMSTARMDLCRQSSTQRTRAPRDQRDGNCTERTARAPRPLQTQSVSHVSPTSPHTRSRIGSSGAARLHDRSIPVIRGDRQVP